MGITGGNVAPKWQGIEEIRTSLQFCPRTGQSAQKAGHFDEEIAPVSDSSTTGLTDARRDEFPHRGATQEPRLS